jgi:hypothetical protein
MCVRCQILWVVKGDGSEGRYFIWKPRGLKEGVWQRRTAKECVGVTSVELWVKEEREKECVGDLTVEEVDVGTQR